MGQLSTDISSTETLYCQYLVMSSLGGIAIISLCQLLCEEHCHSCYLLENLFMFLDTWVFFCSFNVKTIKEGENSLFIYLYFYSQGCLLTLGKYDVVLTS